MGAQGNVVRYAMLHQHRMQRKGLRSLGAGAPRGVYSHYRVRVGAPREDTRAGHAEQVFISVALLLMMSATMSLNHSRPSTSARTTMTGRGAPVEAEDLAEDEDEHHPDEHAALVHERAHALQARQSTRAESKRQHERAPRRPRCRPRTRPRGR